MAFRVHAQPAGYVSQHIGYVFVQQLKRANADRDEQGGLEQFVQRNQLQPAIALLPRVNPRRGQLQIAPEGRQAGPVFLSCRKYFGQEEIQDG